MRPAVEWPCERRGRSVRGSQAALANAPDGLASSQVSKTRKNTFFAMKSWSEPIRIV